MATATTSATKLPGYETTFITKVDLTDEALKTLKDRLNGVVKAYTGELVYNEDWGKRKFAYPIQKEVRGHYTYMVYTGKGDVVAELERNLRLNDQVLRFMTVNLAKEFNKDAYTKEQGAGTLLKREDKPAGTETPVVATETKAKE
jgi:small subunit ribosomal protein S6